MNGLSVEWQSGVKLISYIERGFLLWFCRKENFKAYIKGTRCSFSVRVEGEGNFSPIWYLFCTTPRDQTIQTKPHSQSLLIFFLPPSLPGIADTHLLAHLATLVRALSFYYPLSEKHPTYKPTLHQVSFIHPLKRGKSTHKQVRLSEC